MIIDSHNIDSNNIDSILARFFDGDTTCAEDRALQEYFAATDPLPERLRAYAPMFAWYSAGMPGEPGDTPREAGLPAPKKRFAIRPAVWWSAAAAVVAIVVGIGWHNHAATAGAGQLMKQYEGSYTQVNGVINTNIQDIKAEIDLTQLEAQRIEQELEAAALALENESSELNSITTQNPRI